MDRGDAAPSPQAQAAALQEKHMRETRKPSFLSAFRKHRRQQIVANALEAVNSSLNLILIFVRDRVFHGGQLAGHLTDRDLTGLFVLVRLDGLVAGLFRKSA